MSGEFGVDQMNSKIIQYRDEILKLVEQHDGKNVRIFGSQVRNEETENSDVDLLVEFNEPDLFHP